MAAYDATIANSHGKSTMASKAIRTAALVAIVAVAAYWYWSPYEAMWQLKSAAQSGDAAAFNEHVDYARVRESLKSQFAILLESKLNKPASGSNNGMAGFGPAFGAKLGMVLVNRFVDAIVRPETLMRAMQRGELLPVAKTPSATPMPSRENAVLQAGVEPKSNKLKWDYERQGVSTVFAHATSPNRPDELNQEKLGVVLQRSGFATWKLVEVRLPASSK